MSETVSVKTPEEILCEKKTRQIRDVLITNWAVYTCSRFRVNGSALITGVNESGKSTAIDALVYAMFGITDFNLQAGGGDDERSVYAYVIGDTKDNEDRYLRGDRDVTSYIALDIWNPVDHRYLTEGVCIELFRNENRTHARWFVVQDAVIDDFNFYKKEGNRIVFTARQDLRCKGKKVEMMKKEVGIATFLRACGVHLNEDGVRTLRGKIKRLLACGRKKMDINSFIRESIFEEDTTAADSLQNIIRHRDEYNQLLAALRELIHEKNLLQEIEQAYFTYMKEESRQHQLEIAHKNVIYLRQKEKNDQTLQEIRGYADRHTVLDKQIKKADKVRQKADHTLMDLQVSLAQQSAPIEKMREEITELKVSREAVEEQIDVLKGLRHRVEKVFYGAEEISGVKDFFSTNAMSVIGALTEGRYSEQEMTAALQQAEAARTALCEYQDGQKTDLSVRLRDSREKTDRLRHEISVLKMNRRILPPKMEPELDKLREIMKKENIGSEVRVLCDLVNEVDPRWQSAAESFLAGRRFNIIVEPKDVPAVLQIIHDHHFYHLYLVLTNRMEDISDVPEEGSLAARFTIANLYARKYINYVCGRIVCVETLKELNDHPNGAIMPDGMMAQGVVAHRIEPVADQVLGRDAVARLLEKKNKAFEEADGDQNNLKKQLQDVQKRERDVQEENFTPSHFDLTAPAVLPKLKEDILRKTKEVEALEKNPSLKQIMDLLVRAQEDKKKADQEYTELHTEISQVDTMKRQRETELADGQQEAKILFEAYDRLTALYPQEKQAADEISRQDMEKNVKEASLQRRYQEITAQHDRTKDVMFKAMYAYTATHDNYTPSVSGAEKYIRRLDDLRNRDLDEAENKVRSKEKAISDTFMHDFIEVIYARISAMRDQKDAINRILTRHAFGDKTYSIVMKERNSTDMEPFFYLARQLEKIGGADTLDLYLAANQSLMSEGDFADKFAQFRDTVLETSDMETFTDYRQYYSYDVLIRSKDGHSAYLSKSQGIYSGGGKQTPYFILLTAALMTSYGSEGCCIRPAIIDEAFAALDGNRIQSMINYFNDMGLQVFYAAPPEKMANISPLVSTTIAVVKKGRQADIIDAQADLDVHG